MIRLFIFLLICQPCFAQIKLTQLNKQSLPPGIRYTGKIIEAVSWKDKLGDNYVVTTETGKLPGRVDTDMIKSVLHAYHYLKSGDSLRLTWSLFDYVDECPFDVKASFVKKAFAVTDLNKNGQAEIWLTYQLACRSDVSPAEMKIIMYENDKKYALRGETKVQYSEKEFIGGSYTFDAAFKKAAPDFRKYAEELWKKNVVEKWTE